MIISHLLHLTYNLPNHEEQCNDGGQHQLHDCLPGGVVHYLHVTLTPYRLFHTRPASLYSRRANRKYTIVFILKYLRMEEGNMIVASSSGLVNGCGQGLKYYTNSISTFQRAVLVTELVTEKVGME